MGKAVDTGNIYDLALNVVWLELGVCERGTEDERKDGVMSSVEGSACKIRSLLVCNGSY